MSWSIISTAAGTSPRATMADTAAEASSIRSKMARTVFTAGGRRRMRTTILVAMPKVPSEPTKTPTRSYPRLSRVRPPSQTISPSGSTTSSPRTWFVVTPYLSV